MDQSCKAAMAARVGLGHLLDNLEDSRWPSCASWSFSFVLATLWWMDGCGGRRRQRQFIEKHLGQMASWTGPEIGQVGWPRPTGPDPFRPRYAPRRFSVSCWLAPFCMWTLDVVFSTFLDRAPCRASFRIFCLGPRIFVPSHRGPWLIWSHVHLECWLVSGFMIFS
jgi:hypothetical protein